MIERFFSRFRLFFLFTLCVFILLWFNIALSAVIIFILLRLGILEPHFYENAFPGVSILLGISMVIGLVITNIGTRLMLNPIQKILKPMKKLAGGDFTTRIDPSKLSRIIELQEFADQFNTTAKALGSIEMLQADFVNNFSHEFKTPIVSLKGFARLLKKEDLTEEQREAYLDIIIAESGRLADLATNVLDLTRIENKTMITDKITFDLGEQVRRAILMMESKWSGRELQLEMELDEVSFHGNAELLHQVWINVLDNAVKFSNQGGKVEIKLQDFYDSVVFKVRDYGCGMDEETRARLFDKFYQGDTSHTTEGNGLGMAVIKKIVSLHDGEITVRSKPENGSQITITLPKRLDGQ